MFSPKVIKISAYIITIFAVALICTGIWKGFSSTIDIAYEIKSGTGSESLNEFNPTFSKYDDFLFNTGKNDAFNGISIPVNTQSYSRD